MAGNVCLLKHAPNVWGCAEAIERVFLEAGFERGIFQHLQIGIEQVQQVIAHKAVRGIALTGSERAGASVAALAGSQIKKTVLELGGSNALVVLADADLDKAAQVAVQARMMNSGQSCIAAKRLIVVESVAEGFTQKVIELIQYLQVGDPFAEGTQIGPLARPDLVDNLARQVRESVEKAHGLPWAVLIRATCLPQRCLPTLPPICPLSTRSFLVLLPRSLWPKMPLMHCSWPIRRGLGLACPFLPKAWKTPNPLSKRQKTALFS